MGESSPPLSSEQVAAYLRDGVLVVDGILTVDELAAARQGLATTLQEEYGVDVHDLPGTGRGLVDASSTNGAGGVLDVFYPDWKMKLGFNEKLFIMTRHLWKEAYCHDGEGLEDLPDEESFKWHPFGAFSCNRGYMYIDRVGYRIPTVIAESIGKQLESEKREESNDYTQQSSKQSKRKKKRTRPIQRSLTPHLDCCPETYHDAGTKTKWRPIQCFVSLTDNLEPNTGGFEAAPGFHREFRRWTRDGRRSSSSKEGEILSEQQPTHPQPCVGEYTHLSPSHDRDVLRRVEHIPVRAGSAVFWDNRIPHANSYRNDPTATNDDATNDASALGSSGARAVVYCSFLPDVPVNQEFVRRQLEDWRARRPPRVGDRWIRHDNNDNKANEDDAASAEERTGEGDAEYGELLSELGKRLIGLVEWA